MKKERDGDLLHSERFDVGGAPRAVRALCKAQAISGELSCDIAAVPQALVLFGQKWWWWGVVYCASLQHHVPPFACPYCK